MADLAKLSVGEITTHYLFANTPSYLYRKLRADDSVKALADSSTPIELAAIVERIDQQPERTPEDIATAYAALVAATFHGTRDVRATFGALSFRHLDWAYTILRLWYDTQITTDTRFFAVRPREAPLAPVPSVQNSDRLIVLPGKQT